MQLSFWKYHGLGNDFVLVDAAACAEAWTPALAAQACDRHRGIGADGVLVCGPSEVADFRMIIHNADGSRPEMCGNGLRCFARYVFERGYTTRTSFQVETDRGVLSCSLPGGPGQMSQIRIEMGAPILAREQIPMTGPAGRCLNEPLVCEGETFEVSAVSMGNPHLILFEWEHAQRERFAPLLERHPRFPRRTNVEFVRVCAPDLLDVIVYERGCGYTEACGTGACAVAVAAILTERVPSGRPLEVRLPGGSLTVEVAPTLENVWMTGPAVPVFQGIWTAAGLADS